ncbi:DNA pilot protein [robinz microvirus RP_35]|nr:DNA pilot protein [robinz microvirus RP_35]
MLSKSKQRGWAWLAWAAPAAAKLAGDVMGVDSGRKSAHEQMDAQREFAQMGIRWKVEDAKAAGVHPLYALGAQTHSYSPVQVGDQSVGRALGDFGQNLGRAYNANATREEQAENARQTAQAGFRQLEFQNRLALERHESQLANDAIQRTYTQSLIDRNAVLTAFPSGVASSHGPIDVRPIDATRINPDTAGVEMQRSKQTYAKRGAAYETAGTHPGFDEYRYGRDRSDTMRLPNSQLGETLENMGIGKYPALIEMYRGLWEQDYQRQLERLRARSGNTYRDLSSPLTHPDVWSRSSSGWRRAPDSYHHR